MRCHLQLSFLTIRRRRFRRQCLDRGIPSESTIPSWSR
ncbi:ribosomal protein S8 [Gardnerella vaginalis 5-1]|nr:ribosomal protein S8 [Gardnerella vaginalis 5-1]